MHPYPVNPPLYIYIFEGIASNSYLSGEGLLSLRDIKTTEIYKTQRRNIIGIEYTNFSYYRQQGKPEDEAGVDWGVLSNASYFPVSSACHYSFLTSSIESFKQNWATWLLRFVKNASLAVKKKCAVGTLAKANEGVSFILQLHKWAWLNPVCGLVEEVPLVIHLGGWWSRSDRVWVQSPLR